MIKTMTLGFRILLLGLLPALGLAVKAQSSTQDEAATQIDSAQYARQLSSSNAQTRQSAAEALARLAAVDQKKLVEGYVLRLKLDPNVTVHSLRVTALTTARERGSDIIDLQDFAGHSDPRTTLCYIRNRDRLEESPAYVIKY